MITGKDLQKVLETNQSVLDVQVDQWLEKKVLPFFTRNGFTTEMPNSINSEDLVNTLGSRGIVAEIMYGDLGRKETLISISVPPQGG